MSDLKIQGESSSRKLAAIMFTDIAGYTTLMGEDEDNALEILRNNRALQKPLIEQYDGKWLKEMGDGVLAYFDSVYHAVKCALEIQINADKDLKEKIRIGIHLGDVTFEGEDIFGDGVNIASRLESVASPGGVYFSESVFRAIRNANELKSHFVGEIEFKNVSYPIKTYCLRNEGLPPPLNAKIRNHLITKKVESLAVLPFENLSGNPEQQFFVNGMHDALIGELSKIGSLRIISRTSTLLYQNSNKTVPQIAEELGVDGIIEASVLRIEDQVRIQAQLIQAFPKEQHLWANSYDKTIENILALHSEVVRDITKEIEVKLSASEEIHLANDQEINPEAYIAYLKGKFHWEKLSAADFEMAIENFNKAIDIEPTYAPPYAWLAGTFLVQVQMGLVNPEIAFPKVYEYLQLALEFDKNYSESHYISALVSFVVEWNWEKSEKSFLKAIQVNPNNPMAHAYYGHLLLVLSRFDESIDEMEKAIKMDPNNPLVQSLYGVVLVHTGDIEKAQKYFLKSMRIDPNNILNHRMLETIYYVKEDFKNAFEMQKKILINDTRSLDELEKGYDERDYKYALELLAKSKEEISKKEYVQPVWVAFIYIRLKMHDDALNWLEKGYEIHDQDMPYAFLPAALAELGSNPGFIQLAKKMKLPI